MKYLLPIVLIGCNSLPLYVEPVKLELTTENEIQKPVSLAGNWVSDSFSIPGSPIYWRELHITPDSFVVSCYYDSILWEKTTTINWFSDDSTLYLWNRQLFEPNIDIAAINVGYYLENDCLFLHEPTIGRSVVKWVRYRRKDQGLLECSQ